MPPMVPRFVASALLALPLVALACISALGEPEPAGGAPSAVAEPTAAQPTPEAPVKVVIGAYVNDIQELDFKTTATQSTSMSGFAGRGLISTPRRPWSS
jgi:hypothetical protein